MTDQDWIDLGRRAWECACNDGDGWTYFSAHAEAAALVAALESAP